MPYVLGVDIGSTTTTAAAVVHPRGSSWEPPEAVPLSPTGGVVPSVLLVSANRALAVADSDDHDGHVGSGWIARGFLRRIGDDVPLLIGGEACPAQALAAMLAMWVVEQVVAREVGLTDVTLVPGPVAVAAAHAVRRRAGWTYAVHTLGGETFEPAVVDRAEPLGFTLRGAHPEPEPLGGSDLDDVLLAGGSARVPLVRRLLAARFPVPVEVAEDPQLTVALGAALVGSHIVDRQRGNRPPPRPPVMRPPRPGYGRRDPVVRRGRARPPAEPDTPGRYDDPGYPLPPRPPIRITPLELPMRVLSRRAVGRG